MVMPASHSPSRPVPAWHLGLYSVADAARYSRIPPATVHRWLADHADRPPRELISFDEFVTLVFIRELRERHVAMREIRRAERYLRDHTGHEHPFAHETLWVMGHDVMVMVPADQLMSANRAGQLAMPGVAHADLLELRELVSGIRGQLGYLDGRAAVWRPTPKIEAQPAVQFGLTCIEGTRLTTRVLFDVAEAGDSTADIARMFEVSEADVERAVTWERRLAA